jgi:hypothetical protein
MGERTLLYGSRLPLCPGEEKEEFDTEAINEESKTSFAFALRPPEPPFCLPAGPLANSGPRRCFAISVD